MYLEGSVQLQAENGDGSSSGVFVVGLAFEDEAVEILGIGCPAAPYLLKIKKRKGYVIGLREYK